LFLIVFACFALLMIAMLLHCSGLVEKRAIETRTSSLFRLFSK
jgi:hypothetical protein